MSVIDRNVAELRADRFSILAIDGRDGRGKTRPDHCVARRAGPAWLKAVLPRQHRPSAALAFVDAAWGRHHQSGNTLTAR